MLVPHSDAAREWPYDPRSPIGCLDRALAEVTPVPEDCKERDNKFTGRIHK